MKKNMQRIMATILTVIMMVSMLPSNVFAADFDADMFVEPAVEAVSVPAEEQEIESTVEDISVEEAETVQGASEEIETVEAADPAAADEIVDADAPVVDDKTTLKAEGKDYVVTVTYDAFANLPDDVKVIVKEIKENAKKYDDYCDQALEAVQQENADVDELSYVRLFDISLVNAAGKTLEPASAVDVQIRLKDVESVEDTTQVVHFAGKEEIPEVIEPTVEDDTVAFATDGFSIYAVVAPGETGENARLTVNFVTDDKTTAMYVKQADVTKNEFNKVLYDPGVPVVEGKKFVGWTDVQNYTLETEPKTIDDIRTEVKQMLANGVQEGASVTYYAMMFTSFELYYQDEQENTFKTENLLTTGTTASTTVNIEYTLQSDDPRDGLVGWKVKDTTEPVYKNGETIIISEDTILIPAVEKGTWLFFDENDGGTAGNASYTRPQFVLPGKKASRPAEDPKWDGYTFGGWYTDAECTQEFDFNKALDTYETTEEGKVYAYAKWTPNATASYKVVIWAQKVTDDKNAETKNYDYKQTYQVNNVSSDTVIDEATLRASSNNYFTKNNAYFGADDLENDSTAFKYARYEIKNGIAATDDEGHPVTKVNPDNSTVVNVYYDRSLFTINFFVQGQAPEGFEQGYMYQLETGHNVSPLYGVQGEEYVELVRHPKYAWTIYASYTGNVYRKTGNGSSDSNYTLVGHTSTIENPSGEYWAKLNGWWEKVTYKENGYYYTVKSTGEKYTGNRYKKVSGYLKTVTGLYGQDIEGGWTSPGAGKEWKNIAFLSSFTGNLFGTSNLGGVPNAITAWDIRNTNTTVIFYVQHANDNGYDKKDTASYYIASGKGFNLTPRYLGVVNSGYAWSSSADQPTSWSPATGDETSAKPATGGAYLHIRYDRSVNDIIYMQGTREITRDRNVRYQEDLRPHSENVPADSTVILNENEFFTGWYEDPEGVKRVDWTGTMPNGNKIIYAVVRSARYHVVVDVDGATLPSNQKTEFWADWGEAIVGTNFEHAIKTDDQGNPYTLLGYYTDEDFKNYWDFSIKLTEESLWHKYDDSNGEDPARNSSFFGPNASDSGYPQVVGIFRLFAKWRNDSILSQGGLHIKYVNPEGAKTYSYIDPLHYADKADIIAAQAPTQDYWPDGKRFAGWQLTEGHVYQPGDIFVGNGKDAVLENDQYWITLTATYVNWENRTPTHITWYKNYESDEPAYKTDKNLGINEKVDIYGTGDNVPTRDGYEFLGWAKDNEYAADGTTINTRTTKTEANFLEYKNGKYYIAGTEKEAFGVAADEVTPYEALYAIWKVVPVVHIYHSATGETEDIVVPKTGLTLDLTGKVTEGNLYGGYYRYSEDDEGNAVKGEAYTASGKTLSITEGNAGTTYYLKEVPNRYYIPTIYITYSKLDYNPPKPLRGLWLIMNIDPTYKDNENKEYKSTGFIISEEGKDDQKTAETSVYDNLSVTKDNKPTSYGLKDFYGGNADDWTDGVLAVKDMSTYATNSNYAQKGFTVKAYFVTQDGVEVTGIWERTYNMGNQTFTGWSGGDGLTITTKETAKPAAESAAVFTTNVVNRHTYVAKSAPDILAYTVTKVDNGNTVSQVVNAGDNTGQITYAGKKNYVFAGWYLDKSFTKAADFSAVSSDMTVYAKYVKTSAIGLSFTKKSSKSGSVTLKATLKISGAPDLTDVDVNCDCKGKASEVKFTGVKTTKSGKTEIKTYTGTVTVSGLANKGSFDAAISFKTSDGTTVSVANKTCKYTSGLVTVK